MTAFRIHFTDGSTLDVDAETPDQARKKAKEVRDTLIKKVKVVKEQADA